MALDEDGLAHLWERIALYVAATPGGIPVASRRTIGGMMPDESTITVSSDGVCSVIPLTAEEIVDATPIGSFKNGDEVYY